MIAKRGKKAVLETSSAQHAQQDSLLQAHHAQLATVEKYRRKEVRAVPSVLQESFLTRRETSASFVPGELTQTKELPHVEYATVERDALWARLACSFALQGGTPIQVPKLASSVTQKKA